MENGRIDANHYAHLMIVQTLTIMGRTLEAGKSIQDGLMAYSINVENLETVCYANDWIDEENSARYAEVTKNFFEINNITDSQKMAIDTQYKLSRKKLEFLLKEVLSNQMKYMELEI